MARLLLCVALLAPSFGFAKVKVVLDAPKPFGPLIEKALKAKYTVIKQSLSDSPTSGDVKAACREAGGAHAVITARAGGGDSWTVMVLNGADGTPLTTFRLRAGKKPPKALPKPDVKKLLDGLDDAKAPKKEETAKPPPEEKAPVEEKKPAPEEREEAPPAEERTRSRKPSEPPSPPAEEVREAEEEPSTKPKMKNVALKLGLGFKMFNRLFGYTDDIFNQLSTYYLPRGPAIGAELELFPAAFITNGFAGNIGVMATFDWAVGISSKAEDMTKYSTTALNLRAALTVRVPAGPLTIQPHFGYSLQSYAIAASSGVKPNIPSVSYGALRGGLLLKLMLFGPVGLQVGIAGQYLLSKGEISTYFPHASANGLDTGGALVIGLFDRFEVKIGGEYQRYWYSMNSVPGDTYVAGGALDIYVSGNLSVAVVF